MTPIKITAELRSGFAAAFDWALSLEGILAYQLQLERLGPEEFALTHGRPDLQVPVEGLPLAVERWNEDWWYQCSRPLLRIHGTHVTHLHRRFNAQEAERYANGKFSAIQTTKGPYKNARMAITRFITSSITWHAIGDPAEVRRLLAGVTHVGQQRRAGFGAVRAWSVEADGDAQLARLCRAVPVEFARQHGVDGRIIEWPIRPPARLPANQRACIIPEVPSAGQQ